MKDDSLTQVSSPLPALLAQNLYERMLLTRLVNTYICQLHAEEFSAPYSGCHGCEAAQIGSAVCIEVGQDFTLPGAHDLGVFLTIGMTPYEVFRAYLERDTLDRTMLQTQWTYHKHNTVTSTTSVATQILHAAGIAFATKLRKTNAVTIAYCGDDVVAEPDFLEGVRFSALHKLPILFVCEHRCRDTFDGIVSCLDKKVLPENLSHRTIHGGDVMQVYGAMQQAMLAARTGQGPILLEIVVAAAPHTDLHDPLLLHKQYLQEQKIWNEEWATQLQSRLQVEVEQAMRDALRDA